MRDDNKPTVGNPTPGVAGGVIHIVHILDASTSMGGGKYTNALAGVNEDIEIQAKAPNDGVTVTISVVEFSSDTRTGNTTRHYIMTPVAAATRIAGRGAHGNTPLFQTVGETIEELVKLKQPADKVLLKIFTDGEENSSTGLYKADNVPAGQWTRYSKPRSEALTKLIKQVEDHHNFTVTFMGTKEELATMETMGFMPDNMMAHMNTAESIGSTYTSSNISTVKYRKEVMRGAPQEELRGKFFKRLDKEEEKTK